MRKLLPLTISALAGVVLAAVAFTLDGPVDEAIAEIDFGSVGEWAGALITAAAIILGAHQFSATHDLDRKSLDEATAARSAEQAWNETQALEEARGRAAQIQPRVLLEFETAAQYDAESPSDPLKAMTYQVHNLSDRPVFDAWLNVVIAPGFGYESEKNGPLGTVAKSLRLGGIPVSESPGSPSVSAPVKIGGALGIGEIGVTRDDAQRDRFVAEVVFRDFAGVWWRVRSDRPPVRCVGEFVPVDEEPGEYLAVIEDLAEEADRMPFVGEAAGDSAALGYEASI